MLVVVLLLLHLVVLVVPAATAAGDGSPHGCLPACCLSGVGWVVLGKE